MTYAVIDPQVSGERITMHVVCLKRENAVLCKAALLPRRTEIIKVRFRAWLRWQMRRQT